MGGQAQTTVHVPNRETDGPGDTLTVLVDPDNPGYAELPGSPSTPAALLTIFLAIPSIVEAQSTFAIRTILSRGPLPLDHWHPRLTATPGDELVRLR